MKNSIFTLLANRIERGEYATAEMQAAIARYLASGHVNIEQAAELDLLMIHHTPRAPVATLEELAERVEGMAGAEAAPPLVAVGAVIAALKAAAVLDGAQAQEALTSGMTSLGVAAEADGAVWRAGAYYVAGSSVIGGDGVIYLVAVDHISDNQHLPQAPSGRARYTPPGAEALPDNVIEWLVGAVAEAGQLVFYTDGRYYPVLTEHTMGWGVTPGGYDPEGVYGNGQDTL